MKHLSNIFDPTLPNAKLCYVYSFEALQDPALRKREWQWHLEWVEAHIVGPPLATESYTVEELEGFGMVGIYAEEESEAVGLLLERNAHDKE